MKQGYIEFRTDGQIISFRRAGDDHVYWDHDQRDGEFAFLTAVHVIMSLHSVELEEVMTPFPELSNYRDWRCCVFPTRHADGSKGRPLLSFQHPHETTEYLLVPNGEHHYRMSEKKGMTISHYRKVSDDHVVEHLIEKLNTHSLRHLVGGRSDE